MAEQAALSLEGWFCLHLFWKIDWSAWRQVPPQKREDYLNQFSKISSELDQVQAEGRGSHYWCQIQGQKADLGLMILGETLNDLQEVETRLNKLPLFDYLHDSLSYLSVTEVGLYSGQPKTERGWAHVKTSLYPTVPDKSFICFYPMSKTRIPNANWYTLPFEQRKAYMHDHSQIGRSYADRVAVILTGSIGLDDYEWGVSLFADDPIEFKKIVTEMRYIEASSIYGEFPYFLIGSHTDIRGIGSLLLEGLEG